MEELDHLDDGRSERAELMKDSLLALEIGININFFLSVLLNLVDFVISLLMSNEIRARPLVEKDIGTVGVGIVSVSLTQTF